MRRKTTSFCAAAILCLLLSAPVSAGLLWDNGPINGTKGDYTISGSPGFTVGERFGLGSDATLTEVVLGLWSPPGDSPSTVDWSIWDIAGSTDLFGPTTAKLSNVDLGLNSWGFNLWMSTFSLPSIPLSAGGYWLEIGGATTLVDQQGLGWDANGGPCLAEQGWDYSNMTPIDLSEAFQILGTTGGPASVPEPSSLALFLGPGLVLAGLLRRNFSRSLRPAGSKTPPEGKD